MTLPSGVRSFRILVSAIAMALATIPVCDAISGVRSCQKANIHKGRDFPVASASTTRPSHGDRGPPCFLRTNGMWVPAKPAVFRRSGSLPMASRFTCCFLATIVVQYERLSCVWQQLDRLAKPVGTLSALRIRVPTSQNLPHYSVAPPKTW